MKQSTAKHMKKC